MVLLRKPPRFFDVFMNVLFRLSVHVNVKLLLDDNRRVTMAATIDAVCSRVAKERQKKIDKGMSMAEVTKELGSEEAHKKKACMKEVNNRFRPNGFSTADLPLAPGVRVF